MSRAINALVSVLQTSEIKLPLLASAEVGHMLDPVNDAVERLSSILVWAVGSLFVQRILLEVAASPVFKWILCSIGVAMTALLLLMEWDRFRVGSRRILAVSDSTLERFRDWLVRLFVVATIVRFIVPAFIALSFLVSQMFLESGIAKNIEQLSLLRTQVSDIASSPTSDAERMEEEKAGVNARMKTLEASRASAREEIERLDARIEELNDKAGLRRLLPDSLGGGYRTAKSWRRRKAGVRPSIGRFSVPRTRSGRPRTPSNASTLAWLEGRATHCGSEYRVPARPAFHSSRRRSES